jgi:hypothetical protein
MASNLSGDAWWVANQAKFPNSARVQDLVSPFRENVTAFINAMTAAGAAVHVTSTLRDSRRAALMQHSWDVSRGALDPAHVPANAGVDINWDHGDLAESQAAAHDMVERFGIAFRPSLDSLHILGRAIDMGITWSGTIQVRNKAGQNVAVGAPRDGATNATLHAVGATYGVKKLLTDKPHWSDNAH